MCVCVCVCYLSAYVLINFKYACSMCLYCILGVLFASFTGLHSCEHPQGSGFLSAQLLFIPPQGQPYSICGEVYEVRRCVCIYAVDIGTGRERENNRPHSDETEEEEENRVCIKTLKGSSCDAAAAGRIDERTIEGEATRILKLWSSSIRVEAGYSWIKNV